MSAPMEPDKKRRLPLLPQAEVAVEGDEDRPPWRWSAIGAVGVFVLWLPLAILANGPLAGSTTVGGAPVAFNAAAFALNAAAFALACFTSGFLIGRFGGKAGRREAMVGGALAGATACLLAATQLLRGFVVWLLIPAVFVTALGGAAARAGGALGVARRKRG